jgi:hypothetical protein
MSTEPNTAAPDGWPGVDNQVAIAAREMAPEQLKQPEWLWYDNKAVRISTGRWARYDNRTFVPILLSPPPHSHPHSPHPLRR